MNTTRHAGHIIGSLFIAQMIGSFLVDFRLEAPLFGAPGYLVAAAAHARSISVAVVLGLMIEGAWAAIAILAFPVLNRRSLAMALWLLILAGVVLALAMMEGAAVMSMLSLSQAYAAAPTDQQVQFTAVRAIVAAARNWPHFLARLVDGIAILTVNVALFRLSLVPRLIAGFGVCAALLQIAGVAMPLFGHDVIFLMLAPVGLSQLILALWLLARGFPAQIPELPLPARLLDA